MFFLRNKRRLEALRDRVDQMEADRVRTARVLEAFQAACSAAGAGLLSAAPDGDDLPPALLLACRAPRPGGEPVVLSRGGRRLVAVVGPCADPDPAQWLAAIRQVPGPAGHHVTRLERAPLPEGLLAVAAVPHRDGLSIRVGDRLTHREARDAIAAATAAARRHGWRDYGTGAASAVALIGLLSLKVAPAKLAASSGAILAGTAAAALIMVPLVNTPYAVHGLPAPPQAVTVHHPRRRSSQPSPTPEPGTGSTAAGQLAAATPATPAATGTTQPAESPSPLVTATIAASPSSSPVVQASVAAGGTSDVDVDPPLPLPSVGTCVTLPLLGSLCLAA